MAEDSRSRARDRVLLQLKTKGPRTAGQLGARLGVTPMAVRQHLALLEQEGLVEFAESRQGIGRPARLWQLTPSADARFPDSHAELTVEILGAVRATFGEDGLDRLLSTRGRRQLNEYRAQMPGDAASLEEQLEALAVIREREGYMPEWSRDEDGGFLFVENHCPICAAAALCQGLCSQELGLFRTILGKDVRVDRTDHILAGARRCAYRIRPAPSPSTRRKT